MGNTKFNSKLAKYFLNNSSDVIRFIRLKRQEFNLDYYDFFTIFLSKFGITIGVVVNIQNMTYRSYINFAPTNILNEIAGERNLIEGVSSDEANEILANKLIEILEISKYYDWKNFSS